MITVNKKHKPFIDRWIEALRSGEYAQGKEYLFCTRKREEQYCCLGVACQILDIPKEKIIWRGLPQDAVEHNNNKLPEFFVFHPDDDTASLQYEFFCTYLASLNDGQELVDQVKRRLKPHVVTPMSTDRGYTFDEIANVIEKNVTYE